MRKRGLKQYREDKRALKRCHVDVNIIRYIGRLVMLQNAREMEVLRQKVNDLTNFIDEIGANFPGAWVVHCNHPDCDALTMDFAGNVANHHCEFMSYCIECQKHLCNLHAHNHHK